MLHATFYDKAVTMAEQREYCSI